MDHKFSGNGTLTYIRTQVFFQTVLKKWIYDDGDTKPELTDIMNEMYTKPWTVQNASLFTILRQELTVKEDLYRYIVSSDPHALGWALNAGLGDAPEPGWELFTRSLPDPDPEVQNPNPELDAFCTPLGYGPDTEGGNGIVTHPTQSNERIVESTYDFEGGDDKPTIDYLIWSHLVKDGNGITADNTKGQVMFGNVQGLYLPHPKDPNTPFHLYYEIEAAQARTQAEEEAQAQAQAQAKAQGSYERSYHVPLVPHFQ